jgi:diguanylate cyclase (GGDEF)-like protein
MLDRVAANEHSHVRLTELIIALRTVNGYEWQTAASDTPGELSGVMLESIQDSRRLLEEGGSDVATIRESANRYLAAVVDEVEALRAGDKALARRMDVERVDPAFDAVLDGFDVLRTAGLTREASTLRSIRIILWTGVIALVGLIFVVGRMIVSARERSLSRDLTTSIDRQFRSLVQSSMDVITVVDGRGGLTVMSPSLGDLRSFATTDTPTSIDALLANNEVDAWRQADRRLRVTGLPQLVELQLARADGSHRSFEARGTRLVDNLDGCVWVWHDISERKKLEIELSHYAFHDTLTGLPNRAMFEDRTGHALRNSTRSAKPTTVLFCDVDDFKVVNDTLGHAAGDELLQVIGDRLSSCLRQGDVLARFGGDEFVILLEDHDGSQAWAVAERMLEVASKEIPLRGRTILPSVSIGVATAVIGATTDELLRNADTALYAAKRQGKGRVQAYTVDMSKTAADLLDYQGDLDKALTNGELTLQYQPTISLATGEVEGVEALLRWHHSTRGVISPVTFIPVAEATGLIIPIGRWILQEACRTGAALQIGRRVPLTMHVNISPRQLHDTTIVAHTKRVLEESGLAPELLVLEVTEGILLDDRTAVQQLHRLRELGLKVAIDDFGTGYTSINYLQHLPVDILKIDRSFVSGRGFEAKERVAFLRAIVSLAKNLGLHTVAEGIETADQLQELCGMGCEAGQGFLWSPAVSSNVLETTIEVINHPMSTSAAIEPSSA